MKNIHNFTDFINEAENKAPTVKEMKKLFDQVNKDCKKSGETVMPYDYKDAVEYYTEQINNIYFESEESKWEESKRLAQELCDYGKGKPPHVVYSEPE